MIKKTPSGFEVTSESGKKLSKADLTKKEALKRLEQIDYFKHVAAHPGNHPARKK